MVINMRILGPESASKEVVLRNIVNMSNVHRRFLDEMFDPLWEMASYHQEHKVDPVGVVAQSAKETAWGRFQRPDGSEGAVLPGFYNTAGIKIRNLNRPGYPVGDERLAHQQFSNWYNGARAQVQHLLAYAGVVLPERDVVDPRYVWVIGKHWCENFEDLSGKWAIPGPTYGQEVVAIARKLQTI